MEYLEYLVPTSTEMITPVLRPQGAQDVKQMSDDAIIVLFVIVLMLTSMSCLSYKVGMYYEKLKTDPILPRTYDKPPSTPSATNPFLKVRMVPGGSAAEEAPAFGATPRPKLNIYEPV
jgi:hypothetical protein